ncbi:hypothetical protein BASA81_015053 [Batrachochytrium salamandrivorans]|nr:hypothetical protein BASA81_015053 [Batrachochytrium salamandrivorans]
MAVVVEEKVEEDLEEEEEVMLGLTLGEMMLIGNGIASGCLSFMSLLARSDNLPYPKGQSFVTYSQNQFANSSLLDFATGVADLFFVEASNSRGGKLVFESLFALCCCGVFAFQLEMSRAHNVQFIGNLACWVAFALMPVCSQVLGVGLVFPLAVAWLLKSQRRIPNKLRSSELDVNKVLAGFCGSMSLVLLQFGMFSSGELDRRFLLPFLLVPLLPSLLVPFLARGIPNHNSQLAAGVLAMAGFLIIGTFGVSIHTNGFGQFEQEMKTEGGQKVVDMIVKNCLSNAPSRFLFVDFVHLCVSVITFAMMTMRGSGGLGLILLVTTVVGPTGSFALLAAHHEFRLMKEKKLF